MTAPWKQTIIVTGLTGEKGFELYCEPEGATHEVLPNDVLTVTFEAAEPHAFEISPVSGQPDSLSVRRQSRDDR